MLTSGTIPASDASAVYSHDVIQVRLPLIDLQLEGPALYEVREYDQCVHDRTRDSRDGQEVKRDSNAEIGASEKGLG